MATLATSTRSTSLTQAGREADAAAAKAISITKAAATVTQTGTSTATVGVDTIKQQMGVRGAYFTDNSTMQAAYNGKYGPAESAIHVLVPPGDQSYAPAPGPGLEVTVRRYWRSQWKTFRLAPTPTVGEYIFSKEKYAYAQNRLQALLAQKGPNLQEAADGGWGWCHYVATMVDCALYATNLDPTVLHGLLHRYVPGVDLNLEGVPAPMRNNVLYGRVSQVLGEVRALDPSMATKRWTVGSPNTSEGGYYRPYRTLSATGAPGFQFASVSLMHPAGRGILAEYNYVKAFPFGHVIEGDRDVPTITQEYFKYQRNVVIDVPNGHDGPKGIIEDLAAWARFIVSMPYETFVIEGFDLWLRHNLFGASGPRFASEDMVAIGDADKAAAKAAFLSTVTFAGKALVGAASGNLKALAENTLAAASMATVNTSSGLFGQPIEQPFRRMFEDPAYTTDVSRGDTQTVIARIAQNSVRLADLVGIRFAEMFRPPEQPKAPPPVLPPPLFTPTATVKRGPSPAALVAGGLGLVAGVWMLLKLRGR